VSYPSYDPNQNPGHQQPYYQQPYAPVQDHPRATLVLILGILSFVICSLLGPFAWVMGRRAVREIDESGGALGGRTQAQVGYIIGMVVTILMIIGVVVVGVIAVIAIASSTTST
jgi:uncharacterized membrane protein YjgN (DUF898 family)